MSNEFAFLFYKTSEQAKEHGFNLFMVNIDQEYLYKLEKDGQTIPHNFRECNDVQNFVKGYVYAAENINQQAYEEKKVPSADNQKQDEDTNLYKEEKERLYEDLRGMERTNQIHKDLIG